MQSVRFKYTLVSLLLILAGITTIVWWGIIQTGPGVLTVAFLDIGQGDSILIQSPTGRRLLVDGGPDGAVLHELATVLPWYSRRIDVVLATHPDADHIGGLSDVLSRYDVSYIIDNSVQHDTPAVESFLLASATEGAVVRGLRRGEGIDLGGGATAQVLFPDRDMSHTETNMASIVLRVSYGAHSFILSGDSPQAIERYLVSIDGAKLKSTVLKAGHHGSNTSSDVSFVGVVSPEYVVYSRGCNNTYGHPHQETLDTFNRFAVKAYDTCTDGTVVFTSDGTTLRVNTKF